ncbi:aromatic ring-hydroxylating dioxygenase subunit alpha [Acinetobacter nosocomialis]|uniref:aromatic ring-hydroxylating dioxygenase subunit alpha n=1 Tax=Acinetobacter nosocomialis TaxID=106654 RepID=UPI00245668E1|nr:aromatic ring-hydroxylating dioxygenase subunit alpha [Acinetobacter nosocomialis]
MFIKNAWYVACRPEEIQDKPLGHTICDEKIVFYRAKENKVAAVEDFCPHRGAPLSLGYVEDGNLVCGYHGLVMGCDGKTVSMPAQRVNGFPCNKAYAVVEKFGFIWVWPGEKALADEAKLPTLEWADHPEWSYGGGLFHIQCDYRLMIDNLMDLTHETYVHSSSIGQKEIDEALPVTKVDGDHVITERYMENVIAPPFWQMALRGNHLADDVPVDRWQRCHFFAPSNVHIEVGVAHAGQGGYHAPSDKKVSSIVVDFITPETETSHWYFWGMARNFQPDNAELTDQIREGQGKIFTEDLEMLEQQQQNILNNPHRKLLMLNIDAGGVQSRKVIDRLLAEENKTPPETSAQKFPNIRII